MDSVYKFNIYNDERDKIFRIVQYATHLLWAYQDGSLKNQEAVLMLKEIESKIILSRQALRFGKFIETFHFSVHSMRLQDNLLRITLTLSRISLTLYLLCDNIIWLSRIGLIRINEKRFQNLAQSYFLYASILSFIKNIHQFKLIHQQNIIRSSLEDRQHLDNHNLTNLLLRNKSLTLDLIKNIFDIMISLDSLGKFPVSPVKIGFMGIISSIIFLLKKN